MGSVFDQIANKVSAGMSARIPSMGAIGGAVGGALVGKFVPKKLQGSVNRALRGDIGGAIADGIGNAVTGFAAKKLGKLQLLGGISLGEAERIASEALSTNYAKKNLWYLQLGEWEKEDGYEDISHAFNMFATDVSYAPRSITSEGKPIGMAVMDSISGAERAELRVTTYDDARGTIRGWFESKLSKVAHDDGTVGLPSEWLIKIHVFQSATDEIGGALFGQFKDSYLMRPTSIEYELSRTEDGLQTIQMTFSQFDTFMYKGK
jgi:outer membrane lipoprotein SlyB